MASMVINNLIFIVDRCMNTTFYRKTTDKPCKPIEEIDKFVEDLEIANWVF